MSDNPNGTDIAVEAAELRQRIKNPNPPAPGPEPVKRRVKAGEQPKTVAKKAAAKKTEK